MGGLNTGVSTACVKTRLSSHFMSRASSNRLGTYVCRVLIDKCWCVWLVVVLFDLAEIGLTCAKWCAIEAVLQEQCRVNELCREVGVDQLVEDAKVSSWGPWPKFLIIRSGASVQQNRLTHVARSAMNVSNWRLWFRLDLLSELPPQWSYLSTNIKNNASSDPAAGQTN